MSSLHGFIMLHRKIMDWEWYGDICTRDVFIHLLLLASFKKTSWQGQELLPGQAITGRKALAEKLGFSEHQVRNAIEKLKSTGEITVKSTNQYSLVTIKNWGFYQGTEEKSANGRPTDGQQTASERPHRNNVNNINKVNKYTPAQAKAKADSKSLSIYGSGKYDYELLRKKARARIRERIAESDKSA